tara:strand:- start:3724 stop:4233 length:510 start_codon:yes stop_codon:yes gene_type:complete
MYETVVILIGVTMAKITDTGRKQLMSFRISPPVDDESKIRLAILTASERGTFETTDKLITHLEDNDEFYPDYVWTDEVEEMEKEGLLLCPPDYGEEEQEQDTYGLNEYANTPPPTVHKSEACRKCGTGDNAISNFGICVECMGEATEGLSLDNIDMGLTGDMDIHFEDL